MKILSVLVLIIAAVFAVFEKDRIVLYYRLIKARHDKKLAAETEKINQEINQLKGDSYESD